MVVAVSTSPVMKETAATPIALDSRRLLFGGAVAQLTETAEKIQRDTHLSQILPNQQFILKLQEIPM